MSTRAHIEAGFWAMAAFRFWAEEARLKLEFDSVVDFEFWMQEIAESLIRSVGIDAGGE